MGGYWAQGQWVSRASDVACVRVSEANKVAIWGHSHFTQIEKIGKDGNVVIRARGFLEESQ
jgi:hypothetical protein